MALASQMAVACDENASVPRGTPYSAAMVRRMAAPERPQVLIFGDSIAARLPLYEIEQAFSGRVIDLAVGGDKIENTRWLLDEAARLRVGPPTAVIFSVGTNNVRDDICAPARAAALLAAARATFPAAELYVFSVLHKGRFGRYRAVEIGRLNEAWRRAAKMQRATYIDAETRFSQQCEGVETCPLLRDDQTHPL